MWHPGYNFTVFSYIGNLTSIVLPNNLSLEDIWAAQYLWKEWVYNLLSYSAWLPGMVEEAFLAVWLPGSVFHRLAFLLNILHGIIWSAWIPKPLQLRFLECYPGECTLFTDNEHSLEISAFLQRTGYIEKKNWSDDISFWKTFKWKAFKLFQQLGKCLRKTMTTSMIDDLHPQGHASSSCL